MKDLPDVFFLMRAFKKVQSNASNSKKQLGKI